MTIKNFRPPTIAVPLLLLVASTFSASGLSTLVMNEFGWSTLFSERLIYCALAMSNACILVLLAKHCGANVREFLIGQSWKCGLPLAVVLGVAVALSGFGVEALLEYPLAVFDSRAATQLYKLSPIAVPTAGLSADINTLSLFLMYVIATPILEELVFRGFIFRRIAQKHGVFIGLIVSSLIFGLFHWPRLLSASFSGLVLTLVYLRNQSLITSMVAHAVANLIVTIGLWFTSFPFRKDIYHLARFGNWWIEAISLGFGVLLAIYVAFWLWPKPGEHGPVRECSGDMPQNVRH